MQLSYDNQKKGVILYYLIRITIITYTEMIPSNVLHRDISQQTFKYYCCIEETEIQFWSTSSKQTGYLQIQNNGATLSSLHSNVRNL